MLLLVLLIAVPVSAQAESPFATLVIDRSRLPFPVSNNAVTSVKVSGREYVLSFAGLGAGKSHTDTLDVTLIMDSENRQWRESKTLPGGVGRLAAAAASVGELAFVFGGYTVAEDGTEVSTPFAHAFDPVTEEFAALRPMPVPVDDTVAVTYQDRYIYLISGWHDLGNVNLVQRYDVVTDSWVQATPIPGNTLFGHAGGIVGNKIVFCDGVSIQSHADRSRDFVMSDECFMGTVDESDSRRIDWRPIASHPGLPRYRMASAGIPSPNGVLFVGGSENPYNYDGIGYDGEQSEPAADGFLLDLDTLSWRAVSTEEPATMDHRGLVTFEDYWLTVGGMLPGQEVSDQARTFDLIEFIN